MSQYGPPGGPYPDEPQDSWPAREPAEQYGAAPDSWDSARPDRWPATPSGTPPDDGTDSPAGYQGHGYRSGYARPAPDPADYRTPGHRSPGYQPGYGATGQPTAGYRASSYEAPRGDGSGYPAQYPDGDLGRDAGTPGPTSGAGYGGPGSGYGTPDSGHGTAGSGYGTAGSGYGPAGSGYGAVSPEPPGWGSSPYGAGYGGDRHHGYSRQDQPRHGEPRHGEPRQGAQTPAPQPVTPAWTPRQDPPGTRRERGTSVPLLALAVGLVVLVFGGLTVAWVMLGGTPSTPNGDQAGPAAGAGVVPTPSQAGQPSTPSVEASTDARFVTTGQCVRNGGTEGKPRMTIVPCGQKTYQVLARFDVTVNGEADAKAKCAPVSGYTNWYFFNSELDTLDFVLCLRLR